MNPASSTTENRCISSAGGWKTVFPKVEKSVGILETARESNARTKADVSRWVEESPSGEAMLLRTQRSW